jgi:hypothetical protein
LAGEIVVQVEKGNEREKGLAGEQGVQKEKGQDGVDVFGRDKGIKNKFT